MSNQVVKNHNFIWGASTSSYQVEGGTSNNDWDFFAKSELIKKRISSITKPSIFYKGLTQVTLEPTGEAVRAWDPEYYVRDFDLAQRMGLNSFRIGLEWARIEPEKDSWDQGAIDHYKEMIRAMRDRGLTPIVTLNHITLPLWVLTPPSKFTKKIGQGLLPSPLRDIPLSDPPGSDLYWKSLKGWENHETIKEFIKYVSVMVQALKDQVDYWITISEPIASIVGLGYLAGLWPPGFFLDGKRAKKVLHNLIEAHVQAYDTITSLDDIDSDGDGIPKKVGFTHAIMAVRPALPARIIDRTLKDNIEAAKNFDYFVNDYFLNAVVYGEEDLNYLSTLQRHNKKSSGFIVHNHWKNKVDFIGLNYYRRVHIYSSNIVAFSSAKFVGGAFINNLHVQKDHHQTHGILNDLGWEIYPEGLYYLIMRVKSRWGSSIPIFITENGVADKSDSYRAPFIITHIQQIKRAIDDGANVIGYLYWSFMDNYEWLENYRPEASFGLFRIERKAKNNSEPEFQRHKTNGARALELIIKESKNGIITDSAITAAKDRFGMFVTDGSRII